MHITRSILTLLPFLMLGTVINSSFAEGPEDYLAYFPSHTNSLLIMRVDELKSSVKAEEEGWNKDDASMWVAGTNPLPRWVSLIVRGSHSHLATSSREWSMSVAPAPASLNFGAFARSSGQKPQTIAGRSAYLSPDGIYVTEVTENTIGVLRPADRADLSRWIQRVNSDPQPKISTYLQRAAELSGQVVKSYDLKDALDPWLLKDWLKASETLNGTPTQINAAAELLSKLEGLTLVVHVNDGIEAQLHIDFSSSVTPIAEKVPALLLEYMRHSGAFVEDLESATTEIGDSSVTLKISPLSDSGFQRLMSLIFAEHPRYDEADAEETAKPADDAPKPRSGPNVKATQDYFNAIEQMLGDLERSYRKSTNYTATAVWHERFAQKISQLPLTGVDTEMVTYGRETSARLTALAASLRGEPLEIDALNSSIRYNISPQYGSQGGWWGGAPTMTTSGPLATGYSVDTNISRVRERQAQAVVKGSKERSEVWQMQINARNEIRDKMYQKYEVDFAAGNAEEEK